jgi:sugar phosphate permease
MRRTYLALFGCYFAAGYGISSIVAGLLLDAHLPRAIWTIQLGAAALGALSLLVLAGLKKRPAVSGQQKRKS